MRITYLFTTFPVASETFLQRELRLMARQGVDIQIHSLWKGKKSWEGHTVNHFRHRYLLRLLWALPYWICRRPDVVRGTLQRLYQQDIRCMQNLGELLMGLGFAVVMARRFEKDKPDLLHGVWATMPATAAWLLHKLTGIPYSMGAHAYDVFLHGGDCLLPAKVASARLIHTTTEATRRRLIALEANPERVVLIRRGLDHFPAFKPLRQAMKPIRLLSVGRMVEKKGFDDQLYIYQALKEAGVPFEARIIGDGRLRDELLALREKLGLRREVTFVGWLDYEAVQEEYAWADIMAFTGRVAANGDRDGLPNVIPEAMASGLLVLTSPVSGTIEAISHGRTGWVISTAKPQAWVAAIREIQENPAATEQIRKAARHWVETHFDSHRNAMLLAEALRQAVGYVDYPGPGRARPEPPAAPTERLAVSF